jgi:circadian clock protein KaiC
MVTAIATAPIALAKAPTGITGLDEITSGGLPRGRTTLVAGGPGCGKTLLGMEFLVCGALQYHEPGVFVAFEETASELGENVRSLGYELQALIESKKLVIDHVRLERAEIEETGEYDLEGLFVRLAHAIDSVGAKRVVIDTLEALFAGLSNQKTVRAELKRLFRWLKERRVTAIVTAERGRSGGITRHGLEEYVSDCVIVLDHRVDEQVSTRRLRVVKYRGSEHGADEYPFLIGGTGFKVFPITSLALDHVAPLEHVSTGIAGLDQALNGRGFLRGSSILVTGTAGAGKTSLAAAFSDASCARGERCLYLSMEESPDQLVRNMRSIGIDLAPWRERGLLELRGLRPTLHGLETHLAALYDSVSDFDPRTVVVDPITNLDEVGSDRQAAAAIARMIDLLKSRGVTAMFTALSSNEHLSGRSHVGVSSWMDAWILLRTLETDGVRQRSLSVVKVRGMPHSDAIHKLLFTSGGVCLQSWGAQEHD